MGEIQSSEVMGRGRGGIQSRENPRRLERYPVHNYVQLCGSSLTRKELGIHISSSGKNTGGGGDAAYLSIDCEAA